MKLFIFILTVILITCIISAALIYLPHNNEQITLEIFPGTPASGIADCLYNEGVIRSRSLFRLYIRLTGTEKKLSYGEFLFQPHISIADVAKQIRKGSVKLYPLTVIEGLTVSRTAKTLSEQGFVDVDKFITLCNDSSFIKELTGLSLSSLEGFLHPETYMLPRNVTEEQIIRTMVGELFRRVTSIKDSDPDLTTTGVFSETGLTPKFYELLILASIVEKEATYDDEKPLIAGVYHNRLRIGKRLQADPTVAYILEEEHGIRRDNILYRDLELQSPYNTYRNAGLPPTPICSPSISALRAVIFPEETEYLFFFANRQGRHIFSRTYREHLEGLRILRASD